MKTVIINIEPSDDYTSIRDKIIWSHSPRVLLVIPRRVRKFPADRDLVLLHRAALATGAQFAIVTRYFARREFAQRIGIEVFHSVAQAEREAWGERVDQETIQQSPGVASLLEQRKRLPKSVKNPMSVPLNKRFLWGGLGFIAFIIFIITLPSAKVIVYPITRSQELTMEVRAQAGLNQTSLTGVIPAVKETITVTGVKTAISSSSVPVGITRADGEVQVQNLTRQSFMLPEGSVFSTGGISPVKFVSLREIEIPADDTQIVIPVEAVEEGEYGNIKSGMIKQLEGIFGSSLSVTNEAAFTGGSSDLFPAPDDEDYNRLYGNLINDLRERVEQENLFAGSTNLVPVPESLQLEEIIDETRHNPIAEASDTLSMTITARFSFLYYDPTDLNGLVTDVMDVSLDEGFTADGAGILIQNKGPVEKVSINEVAWIVDARRLIYKSFSLQLIKNQVRGRNIQEAVKLIDTQIPHYRSAEIIPFVEWWPYVPVLTNRIELEERLRNDG